MKALDTNVLVRFLVRDDRAQNDRVRRVLEKGQRQGQVFLIPLVVALELIWVLDAVYGYAREDILGALEELRFSPVLAFEHGDVIAEFVRRGRAEGTELADLLIGLSARRQGAETTLSFDREAARSDLFERL